MPLASINSNAKHDVVYADNYPTLLLHEPGAQVCDARKAATAIICRAPPAFLKQIMQPFRLHYFLCLVVVADLIENKSHVATAGMHFNRNTATIEFAVNRIIVNRSAEIFKHVCFYVVAAKVEIEALAGRQLKVDAAARIAYTHPFAKFSNLYVHAAAAC